MFARTTVVAWKSAVWLSIVLALFGLHKVTAASSIVSTTGNALVLSTPPASVAAGGDEHNSLTRIFLESTLSLKADLLVDNTVTGAYPPNGSPGAVIPAGTTVSSYFFDFDSVGTSNFRSSTGSVTFDRDILGVIFTHASLNATDCPIGAHGTRYARSSDRPVEVSGNDSFTLSADRKTISFTFNVEDGQDQMRVLVESDPLPPLPISATGDARLLSSPPASVATGGFENNHCTPIFLEQTLSLKSDLAVDNTATGAYPPNGSPGAVIPAGTTVSSYFFNFDSVGTANFRSSTGTVTFDRNILGVIFSRASLNATDCPIGAPETRYARTANRPVEVSTFDSFTISADRKTINFNFNVEDAQDQMRVIVENDPLPLLPVSATGDTRLLSAPPTSVAGGGYEDNHCTRVFLEQTLSLENDLTVDNTAAGVYPPNDSPGMVVPAGTTVSSYFFDFDPVGNSLANTAHSLGEVTFDREIIGVIFTPPRLQATDSLLGAPETVYGPTPREPGSGIDIFTNDTFTLSSDRRTISFDFLAAAGQDQMRVIVSAETASIAPVANAGSDQSVRPGTLVTLDGSGSSDPDGNYPLTYVWEITSKPAGSTATLTDPNTVNPMFTADVAGDYLLALVVIDTLGVSSTPDEVLVSTYNTPPVADAGPDQAVLLVGSTVLLDGSQSYDEDGDPITYQWVITTKPAGSGALLIGAETATPSFVADVHGEYEITLVVMDSYGATSAADTVVVSFTNIRPVAHAGGNQAVLVGTAVFLDGSGSSDANLDPLTYSWSLVSLPAGSAATLSSATSVQTSFTPDRAGDYVVSLVVNDGFVASDPSNVTVMAIARHDVATEKLMEVMGTVNAFETGVFKNANMRNTLTNKLNAVLESIDQGLYADARAKLEHDILQKTDGCAGAGVPDNNDWIKECAAQQQIYPQIIQAIALLGDGVTGATVESTLPSIFLPIVEQ